MNYQSPLFKRIFPESSTFRSKIEQREAPTEGESLEDLIRGNSRRKRIPKRVKTEEICLQTKQMCADLGTSGQGRQFGSTPPQGKSRRVQMLVTSQRTQNVGQHVCRQFKKRMMYHPEISKTKTRTNPKSCPNLQALSEQIKLRSTGKRAHLGSIPRLPNAKGFSMKHDLKLAVGSPVTCCGPSPRCSPRSCAFSSQCPAFNRTIDSIEINDFEKDFKMEHSKNKSNESNFVVSSRKLMLGSVETQIDGSDRSQVMNTFYFPTDNRSCNRFAIQKCFLNRTVFEKATTTKVDLNRNEINTHKAMGTQLPQPNQQKTSRIQKTSTQNKTKSTMSIVRCESGFIPFSYNSLCKFQTKGTKITTQTLQNLRSFLNDIWLFEQKKQIRSYQMSPLEQKIFWMILRRKNFRKMEELKQKLRRHQQASCFHIELKKHHSHRSNSIFCFRLIFTLLEYEIKLKIVKTYPSAGKMSSKDLDFLFCLYYFRSRFQNRSFECLIGRYVKSLNFRSEVVHKLTPYLAMIKPFLKNSIICQESEFPKLNRDYFARLADSPTLLAQIQGVLLRTFNNLSGNRVEIDPRRLRSYNSVKGTDLGQKMLFWISRRNFEQLNQLFASWDKVSSQGKRTHFQTDSVFKMSFKQSDLGRIQQHIFSENFHLPWSPNEIQEAFGHCYIMLNSILLKGTRNPGKILIMAQIVYSKILRKCSF